jgi:hypothetical protein
MHCLSYVFFTLCLALAFQGTGSSASAASAQDVEKSVTGGVRAQAKAQEKADVWSEERAALTAEERDLAVREKWLQYRIQKYEAYVAGQKRAIEGLKQRKEAFAAMQMELEPLLDETAEKLEAAVAVDMPFLVEERRLRLTLLQETLNDHRVSLADKLRRTLEALRIEAEFGSSLEVSEESVQIDGNTVQARVLRIGRLAMFYRTPDGRSGRFNPQDNTWVQLAPEYARTLGEAFDMAERRRAVDLITLPLPEGP